MKLSILISWLALALATPSPAAALDFPPGQAAVLADGWVAAYNAGDRSPLGRALADMPSRVSTGGFELVQVEPSASGTFVGVLKQRDWDRYARLTLTASADGHGIDAIELRRSPRPASVPPPARLPAKELMALLRAKLAAMPADEFSGAVLITHAGRTEFSAAYGLAVRLGDRPNSTDTLFRIGSMNKMITAVAVMQLVQAGKVRLEAPIGAYIADYPNRTFAAQVTVDQLLTHTGGAGDIFGPEFDAHRQTLRNAEDYVALYGRRDPEFTPGSRWSYSNYGFILLGRLIEQVSGQTYDDFVRDHIFRPADMTHTGAAPETFAFPGLSTGYTAGAVGLAPNTDTLPYRGTPAGGGYSTVGDIARFAEALAAHRLLDAAHTTMVMTGRVTIGPGNMDTGGFQDVTFDGQRWLGRAGGARGMNADLRIFPASQWTVVVLANLDPPAAELLANFITARLPLD